MKQELLNIIDNESKVWQQAYPKHAKILKKFSDKLIFELEYR